MPPVESISDFGQDFMSFLPTMQGSRAGVKVAGLSDANSHFGSGALVGSDQEGARS